MPRSDVWTRREALGSGLAAALAFAGRSAVGAQNAETLGLVVKETAGLRRFSYPVHTVLPGIAPGPGCRLMREGRVVPAQFRPTTGADGRPAIALDFTSNLGPLESDRYLVQAGPGIEPGPEPQRGIQVEETETSFQVRSGPALSYTIGARLPGFLESVVNGGREYLEPGSGGLFLRPTGSDRGQTVRLGGEDGRGIRATLAQGPLAVALNYGGTTPISGRSQCRRT